ncbi:MAG: hypothetical protein GF331_26715, partial [Chitinivibrionales bacterium]|nr:hypothetical protein [Chitinivibrionales bacterium]
MRKASVTAVFVAALALCVSAQEGKGKKASPWEPNADSAKSGTQAKPATAPPPAANKAAAADSASGKAAEPAQQASVARLQVSAGDTLSGPLPPVLGVSKSPYLVIADIYVPTGQTVIVEPGVVFLFNSFTGLKVQGTLLARGEDDNPIVFTSVNDTEHNPSSTLQAAPYDWNGIQVTEDGLGTHLSYCVIRYSVFGLASMTRYIRIGPSMFSDNGRADVTIEGREHETGEGAFEYNATAAAPMLPDSLTVLPDPKAKRRTIARYSGMGVLLVGAVLSSIYTY